MRLVSITENDFDFMQGMECDPELMAELGGPTSPEDFPDVMRRMLKGIETDTGWVLKILPSEESDEPAGSISIWERKLDGTPITEIGWIVRREYQGQGIATRAVRQVLDRARDRWTTVYAFPSKTNPASNAVCRKAGFDLVGEREFIFRGHALQSNVWRIDLQKTNDKE